jgi:hypothetical protein
MSNNATTRDFDLFGRTVWNWITEHELWKLQEFADLLEIAEKSGLAESIVFDPNVHETDVEARPGETFFAPTSPTCLSGGNEPTETVELGETTPSLIETVAETAMVQ